ncbi:unnamed protein product [Owenia fusiformis]|uniref:Glutamine amidotransferase domain-containing protein n=1 Tax=Owenia fusiformis TaxID=6347 RepID=A0A8J1YAR4_OWEFU|nr:unnamed protein product [Owenia fusiformis]
MDDNVLTIGYLQCEDLKEYLPEQVYFLSGGYPDMAQSMFDYVTSLPLETLKTESPGDENTKLPKIKIKSFDVKKGVYPEKLDIYAGFIISGSLSGVYDGDPWIDALLTFVKTLQSENRKMVGISFGHQIIAKALGGHVEKNPKGSEISRVTVPLTDVAKEYFKTTRDTFSLLYHHNDALVSLPDAACSIGSSRSTQYQGFILGKHILCFCGHPDYSHHPAVLEALFKWDSENLVVPQQLLDFGLTTLHHKTDYLWVTVQIIKFFMN